MTAVMSRPLRDGLFDRDTPALLGSRCRACDSLHYPPRRACSECESAEVDRAVLPTTGTIRRFTVVRNAPSTFSQPYALAYVNLDHTSIQAFGQVRDVDEADIRIGAAMRVEFGPLRHDPDGTEVIGFWFVPAERA